MWIYHEYFKFSPKSRSVFNFIKIYFSSYWSLHFYWNMENRLFEVFQGKITPRIRLVCSIFSRLQTFYFCGFSVLIDSKRLVLRSHGIINGTTKFVVERKRTHLHKVAPGNQNVPTLSNNATLTWVAAVARSLLVMPSKIDGLGSKLETVFVAKSVLQLKLLRKFKYFIHLLVQTRYRISKSRILCNWQLKWPLPMWSGTTDFYIVNEWDYPGCNSFCSGR